MLPKIVLLESRAPSGPTPGVSKSSWVPPPINAWNHLANYLSPYRHFGSKDDEGLGTE